MNDRVALITGASRGIGRQLAGGLVAEGWTVVGLARSAVEQWEGEAHDRFERLVCDISDESAVKRAFSEVRKRFGRLDLLINNAGAFSGELVLMASGERFANVLRGNLVNTLVVTREAVKLMRSKGNGRVVGVSSIATQIPLPGNALYAASKLGMESLMRGFAVEFRGSGITFNHIAVSFLENTGMVEALKPEARAQYEARLLVPRGLKLDELLATIRFFAADEAATVTGQGIALGSPF